MGEKKLTKTDFIFMLLVAGFFDGMQVLLLLAFGVGLITNTLISIFAVPIFFIWFSIKGIMNMQLALRLFGFTLGEAVPLINGLPLWIGLIVSIIVEEKKNELGPLASAIPGGKGGTSTPKPPEPAPKAPAETAPRQGRGRTTVTVNGKVVMDEERF